MIRFSHSVFALPFALASATLAAREGGVSARAVALDRGRDGRGAQRGDGFQPRWSTARSTPATRARPAASCRAACSPPAEVWLFVGVSAAVFVARSGDAEPAVPRAVAGRARDRVRLLVHEALHRRLAPRARPVARGRARRRLARAARAASTRAPLVLGRRGAALGRGLRRDLRLPGRGVRPPRGAALAAGAARRGARRWSRPRALHVGSVALLAAVVRALLPLSPLYLVGRRRASRRCSPGSTRWCAPTTSAA